jgi:acid phosphatase (class A)
MSHKQYAFLVILLVSCLAIFAFSSSLVETSRKAGLTFTSTATWGTEFIALRDRQTHYRASLFGAVTLPPPPANTASETHAELEKLLGYKASRTPEIQAAILAELELSTTQFGPYTLGEYLDEKKFPATARVLRDSYADVSTIMMREKERFNRVRPSLLEPRIEPLIAVPPHPAYPSGHSTQAHFFAEVLSVLMPERREEFFARAYEIAWHREVAGLHYRSDTEAGMLLAEQIFNALRKDAEFPLLLDEAKREWQSR